MAAATSMGALRGVMGADRRMICRMEVPMGWAGSSLASAIEGALQPLLEKLSPDEVMTAG